MKIYIKAPLAAVSMAAMFTAVYLLGSFVAWNFNPSHWDVMGRMAVVLFGGVPSIAVAAYIMIEL